MRWLTLIRFTGLDLVERPDRDVERFRGVAIVVADEQRIAAIGILVPPFERRCHARATLERWFQRQGTALRRLGDHGTEADVEKNHGANRSQADAGTGGTAIHQ